MPTAEKEATEGRSAAGCVWKARSVFHDLEYWKVLKMPHSLDMMHVTKNITKSLLRTLCHMSDRTKDGTKARYDLK